MSESDARFTVAGADVDEDGKLCMDTYLQLKSAFEDVGDVAEGSEGLRAGEVAPRGIRRWLDPGGAGYIVYHPSTKKTRWFNCHRLGSWRYAFVLARLQLEVWGQMEQTDAPTDAPPARARKRPASASNTAHDESHVKGRRGQGHANAEVSSAGGIAHGNGQGSSVDRPPARARGVTGNRGPGSAVRLPPRRIIHGHTKTKGCASDQTELQAGSGSGRARPPRSIVALGRGRKPRSDPAAAAGQEVPVGRGRKLRADPAAAAGQEVPVGRGRKLRADPAAAAGQEVPVGRGRKPRSDPAAAAGQEVPVGRGRKPRSDPAAAAGQEVPVGRGRKPRSDPAAAAGQEVPVDRGRKPRSDPAADAGQEVQVVAKRKAARVNCANEDVDNSDVTASPEAAIPPHIHTGILGGNDRALALFNLSMPAGREALSSFMRDGYLVVPNVFEEADCNLAVDKLWNFAVGRCPAISASDEVTWTSENWSAFVKVKHLCQLYGAGFVLWEERLKFRQKLIDLGIYADQPHHVSWDGFNFGRPLQKLSKNAWDHTDQVLVKGKSTGCTWVQGSIALNEMNRDVGPAFECWPGTHEDKTFIALQSTEGLCENPHGSFRQLTDAGRGWLRGRGFEKKRVPVGQGDVILWDSRLVHQGGAALTVEGSRCERPVGSSGSRPGRIAAYICLGLQEYTPASVAKKRKDAFTAAGPALTLNHKPDAFEPFKKNRFNAPSPGMAYPEMCLAAKQLHGVA